MESTTGMVNNILIGGIAMVRNKETGFPNQKDQKLEGMPRAQARFASLRADGTINTRPQERMHASNKRERDDS